MREISGPVDPSAPNSLPSSGGGAKSSTGSEESTAPRSKRSSSSNRTMWSLLRPAIKRSPGGRVAGGVEAPRDGRRAWIRTAKSRGGMSSQTRLAWSMTGRRTRRLNDVSLVSSTACCSSPGLSLTTDLGIAYPKNLLDPKEVKDGNFKYQKVFGEDQFIAAGVVYVPIGCKKPGKHSKDNSYVRLKQSVPLQHGWLTIPGLLRGARCGPGAGAQDQLRHGSRSHVHGPSRCVWVWRPDLGPGATS